MIATDISKTAVARALSLAKEQNVRLDSRVLDVFNCQGRRDIRPCGGVKVYHRDVGVQHKCHHAAGVRRIR